MRFPAISAFYSEYNNISKLEDIIMKNLLAKYRIRKKIAIFFYMMFFVSLLWAPIAFENSGYKHNHNSRIEDLNNQLLQAENEEEATAVNVLIKMENNEWKEMQASPAYHSRHIFRYWHFGMTVISIIMLPFSVKNILD